MTAHLCTQSADFERDFSRLMTARRENAAEVTQAVADILTQVRMHGDSALIALSKRLDRVDLTPQTLRIDPDDIARAVAACAADDLAALRLAVGRITDFHRRQKPDDLSYCDAVGVRLGHRWRPVAAAGLYVPGGLASYPSSVVMNAIPAQVAGVGRVVMVVPTPGGQLNPLVLAAAQIAGVTEIYRIGGAQAVAALAYGTQTIAPVDVITGPGNAYVAAAKRQVFGTVGIDMIAGPSEVLIIADADNDPRWVAADLLAQAEHDTSAQAILITDNVDFAHAVEQALHAHLQRLPRRDIAGQSWAENGAVICVRDLAEAVVLANRLAPEHLELAVDAPDALADHIDNAGAIFLGRYSAEALGDYVAGPNHVLPTARSARFSSGLSVLDFMKRSSVISCSPCGLRAIGPAAVTLARAESLDAHALSVSLRLDSLAPE